MIMLAWIILQPNVYMEHTVYLGYTSEGLQGQKIRKMTDYMRVSPQQQVILQSVCSLDASV